MFRKLVVFGSLASLKALRLVETAFLSTIVKLPKSGKNSKSGISPNTSDPAIGGELGEANKYVVIVYFQFCHFVSTLAYII